MPSLFLLRLIDGILSTDHCHVFKLFLLIFLGWFGVVVSRRLTASPRKLCAFVDRLILSTHNSNRHVHNIEYQLWWEKYRENRRRESRKGGKGNPGISNPFDAHLWQQWCEGGLVYPRLGPLVVVRVGGAEGGEGGDCTVVLSQM